MCENDVFALPLNPIDKLTYLALVRYCDSQQRAWPSYVRIAEDVGVGKKRAIEAVKNLIERKLLEKRSRGNRSNIYLVYPARFFSATATRIREYPSDTLKVSAGHPEGVGRTLSEYPSDTLKVSCEHPIITNTITSTNTLSPQQIEKERESIISKSQKGKDLDVLTQAVTKKGFRVGEKVLLDMLTQYTAEEVSAAISCTDFKVARNPLSVIYALLKSGRYVIPKAPEAKARAQRDEEPEEIDRDTLQKYFTEVKNSFKKGEKKNEYIPETIPG